MSGDPGLDLLFLDGNSHWQSLTNKRTGEFLAAKTLRERYGRLNIMKSVLSLDESVSALGYLVVNYQRI